MHRIKVHTTNTTTEEILAVAMAVVAKKNTPLKDEAIVVHVDASTVEPVSLSSAAPPCTNSNEMQQVGCTQATSASYTTPNSTPTTIEPTQSTDESHIASPTRSAEDCSTAMLPVDQPQVIGPAPASIPQQQTQMAWTHRVARPSAAEQAKFTAPPVNPAYHTPPPNRSPSPNSRPHKYAPTQPSISHAGGQIISQSAFPAVVGWKQSKPRDSPPVIKKPLTWWQRILAVVISLRFCLLALMVSSLVIVSVLSWRLTFTAAEESLDRVTRDYSSNLISQIASDLDRRLIAAEHTTKLNSEYFRLGLMDFSTNPDKVFETFLMELRELVKDTVSSLYLTTSAGELNGFGWSFPTDSSPYLARWSSSGLTFTEDIVDPLTGAVLNNSMTDYNTNSSTAAWSLVVDHSDPNSSGWTTPYVFRDDWFVSTSRTMFSAAGESLGIITCDIELGFINHMAQALAAEKHLGAGLLLLNAKTGSLIGSLDTPTASTGENQRKTRDEVLLNADSSPELYQRVHEELLRHGGVVSADEPASVSYSGVDAEFSEPVAVNGKKFLITVTPFEHGREVNPNYYVDWIIVHILDRSTIENEIAHSNTNVLIAVICICFGFVLAMSLLLFYSMNLVSSLSHLLTSFARFEFRKHVEDGQLKSRSVFTELKEMQTAVLEMTMAFKSHLEGTKENFGRNRHSHYTMVIDSDANSSTPRLPLPRISPNDSILDGPAVEVERMAAAALAGGTLLQQTNSPCTHQNLHEYKPARFGAGSEASSDHFTV